MLGWVRVLIEEIVVPHQYVPQKRMTKRVLGEIEVLESESQQSEGVRRAAMMDDIKIGTRHAS